MTNSLLDAGIPAIYYDHSASEFHLPALVLDSKVRETSYSNVTPGAGNFSVGLGATSFQLHIAPTASGAVLTGLSGGTAGRKLIVRNTSNASPSVAFTIPHESSSESTAANRIHTDGSTLTIQPGQAVVLKYDPSGSINRWMVEAVYLGAGGGGGGSGTVTSVNLTAPAKGITVSGGPITSSGSITLALANDLSAVEGLSSTGIAVRTGTDAWALAIIGSDGTRPVADSGSTGGLRFERAASDPRFEQVFREVCIDQTASSTAGGGTNGVHLYTQVGGTTGAISRVNVAGRLGALVSLDTGGNSAGTARVSLAGQTQTAGSGRVFQPGGGNVIRVIFIVRIPTNPSGSDDFSASFGSRDLLSGTSTDESRITINFATNSSNWQHIYNAGGAGAATENFTGTLPTANAFFEIVQEWKANGTAIEYFVNGTSIGTRTSGLPSVSLAPWASILKSAGTTTRSVQIAEISFWSRFGSGIY